MILIFFRPIAYAQEPASPCSLANVINDTGDCFTAEPIELDTIGLSGNFPTGCIVPDYSKWFRYSPNNSFISIYLESSNTNSGSQITLSVFEVKDCQDDFIEVFCGTSEEKDWLHIELPNLKIDKTYLIQIGRLEEGDRELKLCINSYYPFKVPGSNCSDAAIICDEEPKVFVPTEANQNNVVETINLCNKDIPSYNESWYKWQADSDGMIAFNFVPFSSTNNIDFAFYRINDGIDGCDLELLRCESVLNGEGTQCGQQTGLEIGSLANFLSTNCLDENGSFLAPVNANKGETFALRVISTEINAGYILKFNNSSRIYDPVGLGFDAVLSSAGECTFRRKYTANGLNPPQQIYIWDIGPFSQPEGPLEGKEITILTDSLGTSNVQVSSETSFGCILTEVDSLCLLERLYLTSTIDVRIDSIKGIECGEIDGSYLEFSIDANCEEYTGFEYSVDGGPFTGATIYKDLSLGEHEIHVRLDESCIISKTIWIEREVNFNGIIQGVLVDTTSCTKEYDFSIDLTGELSGSETVFWDFGPDANPENAEGPGPHRIQINGFGTKNISALISAGTECSKEVVFKLDIPFCNKETPPEIFIVNNVKADCNNENGKIGIEIDGGCAPFRYILNNQQIALTSLDSLSGGEYVLEVIDNDSCIARLDFLIEKEEDLSLNAGPDIVSNGLGEVYDFILEYNYSDVSISTNSPNIQCLDGPDCLFPSLQINEPETIVFFAENSNGCLAVDSVNVSIDFDPGSILFVPNVFSPNDDGINDKFEIYFPEGYSVKVEKFEIFDRWGNKVLSLENTEEFQNSIPLWEGQLYGNTDNGSSVYVFSGSFIVTQGSIEKKVIISRSITVLD